MKRFYTVFLYVAMASGSFAQDDVIIPTDVSTVLGAKKEVFFKCWPASSSQIQILAKSVSVDHDGIHGDTVYAYANEREFKTVLRLGLNYEVLPHPASLANVIMVDDLQQWYYARAAFGTYPTYALYVQVMQQYAADYPQLCQLYSIGTTPDNHEILLLKISKNVNVRENEPQFLYTSTMHGDETAGYPMMLSLIDLLLTSYGTDPEITSLVDNVEIWINPSANPDGTYAGGDNTVSGATRSNANGIDLNRNYPDPQDGPHPDGNSWQPETVMFMNFADTMDFVMAANFHGGAEVINYPWDTWSTAPADENWWIRESVRYADTCQVNSPVGYMTDLFSGSNPGVTNGFDWYEIDGGRQDYMNWFHQCREFTVELSAQKILSQSELINHWDYNRAALLNYVEESTYGLRGVITDACTGNPIRAKVFINSHDYDSSFVYSSLPVGNYHRPVYPGTYSVTFSAPGYQSVTMSGVTVTDGVATINNIALQPQVPAAVFSQENTACSGMVDFTNLAGSATSFFWYFGDGSTSTDPNPQHVYTGIGSYDVALVVENCAGTDSVMYPAAITLNFAEAPVVAADTLTSCSPQSFTFNATSNGMLNWYDTPGGTLLSSGYNFTTPVIASSENYFVQNVLSNPVQYLPPNDNSGGGSYYTAGSYHYLTFTAFSDFTLVSVLVYANSAGNRTFELRDVSGTVMQSVTANVPSGSSRVALNFNVAGGADYQLGVAGSNNLFRNNAGVSYPYTLAGVVSITGSSAGSAYYYYSYDWEIATNCVSQFVEVNALVGTGGGSVSVDITTPGSGQVCAGSVLDFTANVTNSTLNDYVWLVNGVDVGINASVFSLSSPAQGDMVSCVVTSNDGCLSDPVDTSNAITVTVNSLPVVSLAGFSDVCTIDAPFSLTGGSPSGGDYTVNGVAATTFDPSQGAGTYVVEYTYTDGNGCKASEVQNIQVSNCTGLTHQVNGIFSVYPNPTMGVFYIVPANVSEEYIATLYTVSGKLLSVHRGTGRTAIDLTDYAAGVYILKIGAHHITILKR